MACEKPPVAKTFVGADIWSFSLLTRPSVTQTKPKDQPVPDACCRIPAGAGSCARISRFTVGSLEVFAAKRGHCRGWPGKDQAAKIGLAAYAVKCYGRAVIHHYQGLRGREKPSGCKRAHKTIRAHFLRAIVTVFERDRQIVGREKEPEQSR